MKRRRWTLPIRGWLALALAATFLAPVVVTGTVAALEFGGAWHAGSDAARILRAGAADWTDPAWQAATQTTLARQGVDFVLMERGHVLYRSVADPLAGADSNRQRTVQRVVIGGKLHQVADIYSNPFSRTGVTGAIWLLPLVGLTTLLLTLGVIAWFLGRTLLRPLAAAGSAARQIAAGDLDIALPGSQVREVVELSSAFVAMSAALRSSLQEQAAIEEERRMFVGAIAHDLRTPLFSLRGHLEGLEQGLARTPDKMMQYVHVCREKADVLERLIADLFAYTRIEYLEQTLRRAPFDLGALLRRVLDGRQREAEVNGVRLQLEGPVRGCLLEGDEYLFGRAVENLLDNALRYTSPGGTVTLRFRLDDGQAVFAVLDSGPGIAPRDLPHIFEPMYRADPSRSRETGGTGLGLTIARRILRAHGGDLVAENGPTGGATFTGLVPLLHRSPPGNGSDIPTIAERRADQGVSSTAGRGE